MHARFLALRTLIGGSTWPVVGRGRENEKVREDAAIIILSTHVALPDRNSGAVTHRHDGNPPRHVEHPKVLAILACASDLEGNSRLLQTPEPATLNLVPNLSARFRLANDPQSLLTAGPGTVNAQQFSICLPHAQASLGNE
eukprot:2622527-Rhodomonas_salina.2